MIDVQDPVAEFHEIINEGSVPAKEPVKKEVLIDEAFFDEFNASLENTPETDAIAFIPTNARDVQIIIDRNQEKYDLYDKILSMLSITKTSHFLILTTEKVPFKQDYLYKRVTGVRIIKETDGPHNYEYAGLFQEGATDMSISKFKTYEKVYVEVNVCNQDGTEPKWVKFNNNIANIMVKSIEYYTVK